MIVWYNDSKPESSIRDRNSEFAKHMTIKWSLRLVCIYIFLFKDIQSNCNDCGFK